MYQSGTRVAVDGLNPNGLGRRLRESAWAIAQRLSAHGCPVAIAGSELAMVLLTTARGDVRGPVLVRTLDVSDRHAYAGRRRRRHGRSPWAPSGYGFQQRGRRHRADGRRRGRSRTTTGCGGVNFNGVVNGVRAFLPVLQRQNSGVIVNTSSVFGLLAIPNQSAYCSSKFAVRASTESLRLELPRHRVRPGRRAARPGGVYRDIRGNANNHAAPLHPDLTKDEMVADFDLVARTTPERAAQATPPRRQGGQGPHSHRARRVHVPGALAARTNALLRRA